MPKTPENKKPAAPEVGDEKEKLCLLTRVRVLRALIGNEVGCPLPTVHPESGEALPFGDENYLEELNARSREEQASSGPEADNAVKSLSATESLEVWGALLDFLQNEVGLSLEELRNFDFSNRRKRDALARKIDQALLKSLPFLSKYLSTKNRADELNFLGDQALESYNELIREVVSFEGDQEGYLGWETSVETENNPGELAVKFLNPGNSTLMRHGARQKLFYMILLGMVKHHERQGVNYRHSIGFFMDIFNERLVNRHEKGFGASDEQYLVSYHHPKTKRTLETLISETPAAEEREGAIGHVRPVRLRHAQVMDKSGKERDIRLMINARSKPLANRASKRLRYPEQDDMPEADWHGIRLVFETVQDAMDFERKMITVFQEEYKDIAAHGFSLAERRGDKTEMDRFLSMLSEDAVQGSVVQPEQHISDNLKGGEREGSSAGSSKYFRTRKFHLIFRHPEEGDMHYEFQIMLFDGYLDSRVRHKVNEDEYHLNRAYRDGLVEIFLPEVLYRNFNPEATRERKIQVIRRKIDSVFRANERRQRKLRKSGVTDAG